MLQIGQIFPNYKALCEALNETATTGEAKQRQLKNWETYFSYVKIDQKRLKIVQVYKPFLEEVNPETGKIKYIADREHKQREGIFLQDLTLLLLHNLQENLKPSSDSLSFNEYSITMLEGLIEYGFCHENLKTVRHRTKYDFLSSEEHEEEIKSFLPKKAKKGASFKEISSPSGPISVETKAFNPLFIEDLEAKFKKKGYDTFRSCLKNLARRHFIVFRYSYIIKTKTRPDFHACTFEEESLISSITLIVLKTESISCSNLNEVFLKNKQEAFFSLWYELLFLKDILDCKRAFVIGFTEKQLELSASYRKELKDLQEARASLNNKWYNFFVKDLAKSCFHSLELSARAAAIDFMVLGKILEDSKI